MIVVKYHGGLHIIVNACSSCCWGMTREGVAVLQVLLRVAVRRTHSAAAEEGWIWMRRTIFTASVQLNGQIIYPVFLSPPHSTFFAARSAMLSALNETPSARARYAGSSWHRPSMMMSSSWERGECPQLLRPVNGCRSRCWVRSSDRTHQAGCGFECSESIHKVNVELVEKPVNGPVHTPLLKPPSLPEKTCFFRFRTRFAACMRRTRWLRWSSLVHFPQSHVAFGEVYCSAYIFGSGLCASHGGAVSACHSFASRAPMFSYFGQRVQDKPRKLLFHASKFAFSLDKATMKV